MMHRPFLLLVFSKIIGRPTRQRRSFAFWRFFEQQYELRDFGLRKDVAGRTLETHDCDSDEAWNKGCRPTRESWVFAMSCKRITPRSGLFTNTGVAVDVRSTL